MFNRNALVVFTVCPARKERKLVVDTLYLYRVHSRDKEGNQITVTITRPTTHCLAPNLEFRLPVGA